MQYITQTSQCGVFKVLEIRGLVLKVAQNSHVAVVIIKRLPVSSMSNFELTDQCVCYMEKNLYFTVFDIIK